MKWKKYICVFMIFFVAVAIIWAINVFDERTPIQTEQIYFETGQILNVETILEPDTLIPITKYSIEDANVHGSYVNNTMYVSDEIFFFLSDCSGSENIYMLNRKNNNNIEMITFETDKETYRDVNSFGLTPYLLKDCLYYAIDNTIKKYDIESSNTETVLELDSFGGEVLWAPLYVTKDGEFMSTTITCEDISYICRINLVTQEISRLESPFVGADNPVANHAMINPENPDLIMFAHEGSWVMDRVWFWECDSGKVYSLFKHPDYTEMGHEMWTNNGSEIYIVQYGSPARFIESGINFLDLYGNYTDQIFTNEFYFSHATVSPDGKYIVSDTYVADEDGKQWIVLYDRENKNFIKIATYEFLNHPAHGHPFFSPSGSKIMFNNLVDGRIELNEVSLQDILQEGKQ